MNHRRKTFLFFLSISGFTALSAFLITGMIDFSSSRAWFAAFWIAGFVLLSFNLSYMLVAAAASRFLADPRLPGLPLGPMPRTALVYVVRNEDIAHLRDRMERSLENNDEPGVDLWLVSNSEGGGPEEALMGELELRFGPGRAGYFLSPGNPLRRKHVALMQWLRARPEYDYFLVCDADTVLPPGTVRALAEKAEHPDNADAALFQSHISVGERPTYFMSFIGLGQDVSQRLYARANQAVFGRGVSFGSGCLIRRKAFAGVEVPDWVLSHDIWDTLALEEAGHRAVFCGDVVTQGGFPHNYVEYLRRNRRWIKGTLESGQAVLRARVPAGTRFMTAYAVYMYLSQPFFLLWMLSGCLCGVESLLAVQRFAFLGGNFVDIEMSSHLMLTCIALAGHRFLQCRTGRQAFDVAVETVASTLLCLNNVVFDSLSVLEWAFFSRRGMGWVPMKKTWSGGLSVRESAVQLWPSTLLGVAGIVLGLAVSPHWLLVASPFLSSFLLGIPMSYATSLPVGRLFFRPGLRGPSVLLSPPAVVPKSLTDSPV